MNQDFSSDYPIHKEGEDKFQRYPFAKRIAETIIKRDSSDCITIGIYGAWGEGKTSVINFIENELTNKDNIVYFKFNPWKYNDENSLLLQFFQKLAKTLDKSIKTKKEKIGEIVKNYGQLLTIEIPIVGKLSDKLKFIGEKLTNTDIEVLKERIEKVLVDNKKKVIIFIDDIDRLDKQEIHAIFRLVKLNADFKNTVYILSFDEQMVAAAIGDKFGEGNQKSGQNYLEKIIQVPLKIPIAQPIALQQFCFKLIDKILNSNNIKLTNEEIARFQSSFADTILVRLNTPRLAVRYGNSLSFSIPLLYGEINIIDLMLIEAIKTFYPNHYAFIKLNPEYFIETYEQKFGSGKDEDKINLFKGHLSELGKELTNKQQNSIKELLKDLFPYVFEAITPAFVSKEAKTDYYKQQRIVYPEYFNRYFTYAVIKGDISDAEFRNFIEYIPKKEILENIQSITELIKKSSLDNFIFKLRSYENEFDWETSVNISKSLSFISEIFPKRESGFILGFENARSQAASFIYHIIKKNKEGNFELAKELLNIAQTIEFVFELIFRFNPKGEKEDEIFTKEQFLELENITLNRAIKEAGDIPIFEKYPDFEVYLLTIWGKKDKESLKKYINDILISAPKKCITLLRRFVPTLYSYGLLDRENGKSDFTKELYDIFVSFMNKDFIVETIYKCYSKEEIESEEVIINTLLTESQTDLNIVRQFLHWYEVDKNIL